MRRLAIIPLVVLLSGASASPPPRLVVGLGRTEKLPIQAPVLNVIVGDPAVADVFVMDRRTLLVEGKRYGRSEVIALGAGGRPVWEGEVAVVAATSTRVSMHRGTQGASYSCATESACSQIVAQPGNNGGSRPASPPPRPVSGAPPRR
jgi:Flp pilus assembly secretin CpaC